MRNLIINIRSSRFAGIIRIIVLLAGMFTQYNASSQVSTTAVNGVLNLSQYDWSEKGTINLNGKWAFYWNALYTPASFDSNFTRQPVYAAVPDFWNNAIPGKGFFQPAFGYATYRLKVLCPPTEQQLALHFVSVSSAYKVFVNGKQAAAIGQVGTTAATTTPDFQPVIVPVTPVNNRLDIVIQVANFTYNAGGLWDFIKLGTEEQIVDYRTKNIATDYFIAGSFLLMGIFYLVIYFFYSGRKSPLYFALFCILIGIRPLITGELGIEYVTNWSWQFIKHVEYVSVYLTVPVLSLFSFELFPREFSIKVLRAILIVSVLLVATALFASPYLLRYTLRPFQVFLLLTAFYGMYVYISALKHKRSGSVYLLAGFTILIITAVNDILFTSFIINTTNLLYAGLYILVICQASTLSKQFFQAYVKIKKLNTQLANINTELNVKNDTINATNEQLSKLNAELDTLVFRTSHDLRSPVTSMMVLADLIKTEADTGSRNEYIDFLKKTIVRMDGLIAEILQYAKNKSTALQYEQVDLDAFMHIALQDHIFAYESESVERIVEVSQSGVFETDKARLGMIMNNLISNGLKHHNKEQEHPYLKIAARATEQQAEIEITDNGQGIANEHLDHIFTKFYRVNTKAGGSGFGLYIVKEAIEKLGGTIKVTSQDKVGTSFFIVIPNHATGQPVHNSQPSYIG